MRRTKGGRAGWERTACFLTFSPLSGLRCRPTEPRGGERGEGSRKSQATTKRRRPKEPPELLNRPVEPSTIVCYLRR